MPKRGSATIQMKLRLTRAQHQQLERDAKRRGQTLNAEMLRRLAHSRETETLVQLLLGEPDDAAMLLTLVARAARLSPGWITNSETRRVLRIAIDCMIEACAGGKPEQLPPEIDPQKLTPDVRGKAQAMAILLFEPREKTFKPVQEDTQ